MNAKISAFVIYVEAIIYLLLYNFHDCSFKNLYLMEWFVRKNCEFADCNFPPKLSRK